MGVRPKLTQGEGWSFEPAESGKPAPKVPAKPEKFRMTIENRCGKVVTLLHGLRTLGRDRLETLAKQLKTACGTGGTVKDGLIELQGDRRDQVKAWLKNHPL